MLFVVGGRSKKLQLNADKETVDTARGGGEAGGAWSRSVATARCMLRAYQAAGLFMAANACSNQLKTQQPANKPPNKIARKKEAGKKAKSCRKLLQLADDCQAVACVL